MCKANDIPYLVVLRSLLQMPHANINHSLCQRVENYATTNDMVDALARMLI